MYLMNLKIIFTKWLKICNIVNKYREDRFDWLLPLKTIAKTEMRYTKILHQIST